MAPSPGSEQNAETDQTVPNELIFRNVGSLDRAIRIAVGALALGLGVFGAPFEFRQVLLVLFGWVPLATGLLGWDPLYALLRRNTARH